MGFPKDFIWGAASSSYQTEGAFDEDGKGRSIWDDFCRFKGVITNNGTGDIACDTYHRLAEDVSLMKQLNIQAYRFSLSWPRILPEGYGRINEKGLAFYDALVDTLLENGIEPMITLYHWDMPSALHMRGGWLNRDTIYEFEEYSAVVARRFAGRAKTYIPLNEQQCFVCLGFERGIHAPGLKLPLEGIFTCIHHSLLAQGLSIKALRENSPDSIKIGSASTGRLCYPAENTLTLCEAAEKSTFVISGYDWLFSHNLFLDPLILGQYPECGIPGFNELAASVPDEDWQIIKQPVDFIGLNIYNGRLVDENGDDIEKYQGFPRTAMKWPVTPEVLRFGPRWIYKRYGLPVMISENGQSCNDRIFLDGKVHDPDRIDFLHRYLIELRKACDDGVPVTGYLHWCLTDNFEWHNGYDERFGLIYIDYSTQRRILKDSAQWYSEVVSTNGMHI
jgi:beta-glucosidase